MNAAPDASEPHVLRDYALVADGERGALIGPRGDVVWMCAPRWDDDAVLAGLIGGGGTYAVRPVGRFVGSGAYEPGSLIWRSRWVTTSDIIECREALARPADPRRAVLLRQVRAGRHDARLRVALDLRAGFGANPMDAVERCADGTWTARTGGLWLRWSGAPGAVLDGEGRLLLDLRVPAGGSHDLVLEVSDRELPERLPAGLAWEHTEQVWGRAVPQLRAGAAPRDAAQAYAVLHGLTGSGGGMVAAATMSLPERAEQHRNYDYRYVWIRDQCYAGVAAAAAGGLELLDHAVSFVADRLLADGDRIRPAYRPDGSAVPDERSLPLPGYPGGQDVAGNWVNQQFQLDSLGDTLQLLSRAARLDRLEREGRRALELAVDVIERRWHQPDAGIWELDDAWWTQSRLSCVAGLRVAATVLPTSGAAERARGLAEAILARTTSRCLHPDGHWQRSPSHHGVDASLVLAPVRGALSAADPRTRQTLAAVHRHLTQDGYVYRFAREPDPLGTHEGAFLLCGFMMALAEQHQGRLTNAFRWFERTRAACGSPGLFAEEYDVAQRQLRGNLPQAFVHALLLESAAVLDSPDDLSADEPEGWALRASRMGEPEG